MVKTIPDKVPISRIDKNLVDKAMQYKELTGTSVVALVEGLLTDFFKDKLLTNDYIELPKPYYFNMKELKAEGIVKASAVKPIKELENTYILFNIPNNLDLWNSSFNSYCFEDVPNLHRGYYVLVDFKTDLVFSYDSETEELEIAISNDRNIYFTSEQKEKKDSLITEKEIYFPEIDSYVTVDYEGLNLYKYSEYKYLELEKEDRFREHEKFIEEVERQEEEFYKNQ